MTSNATPTFDFNPNSLPDDLLKAVGLMTAASSQTEYVVQEFIGALLGIDQAEALAVAAHMTNTLKIKVAKTLIEIHAADASTVDYLDDLLERIEGAYGKRNLVVHNTFAIDNSSGNIFSIRERAHGSLQVHLLPVVIDDIKADASRLYDLGIELMRFMLSNNLKSRTRTVPLRQPLDRSKKARQARKNPAVGDGP